MILPTNKRDNILTKALLKLYSYKIVSSSFHECDDYEPFYALTGYIPVSFDLKKEINLSKMFDGNEIEEKKRIEDEDKKILNFLYMIKLFNVI